MKREKLVWYPRMGRMVCIPYEPSMACVRAAWAATTLKRESRKPCNSATSTACDLWREVLATW